MRISIIVAVAANGVIGVDGDLPWRLPEDLRRFKEITMGKPMIMGRLTYESIGKALPGRRSLILSRQDDFSAPGCEIFSTAAEALAAAGNVEEVMIIGGGDLYKQLLPMTDRIYLTRVDAEIQGDTYFPEIDMSEWQLNSSESCPATSDRPCGFTFETLDRITG